MLVKPRAFTGEVSGRQQKQPNNNTNNYDSLRDSIVGRHYATRLVAPSMELTWVMDMGAGKVGKVVFAV